MQQRLCQANPLAIPFRQGRYRLVRFPAQARLLHDLCYAAPRLAYAVQPRRES